MGPETCRDGAHDGGGDEHPELTLDNLVNVMRTTGGIGVVGVYVPEDPALDEPATADRVGWQYGTLFARAWAPDRRRSSGTTASSTT